MSDKKKFIPALGYDWLTKFYDLTIKLTMPETKFRTKLNNGERILEFGFGIGQNLILAYQRNKKSKFIGIDIDPKVKAIAEYKIRKHDFDITPDLYDGKTLSYTTNSFDKVFSSLVFHQLDKETKLFYWGQAKSKTMRFAFYFIQILDGFKTTNDNINGLLPKYMEQVGFKNVNEIDFINTKIGTYSYYKAIK
ncbi:hypothetical protein I4U23_022174 [Adineta vaga]|nr:hypothetical protein I4U23_022174 [Adineta vaga]